MFSKTFRVSFLIAAAGFAQSTSAIDNEQAHVIVALEKPHVPTKMHEHAFNRVMVYLHDGTQTFEHPDGKKETEHWKAGQVLWSPAGGLHKAELISPNVMTIVEVEVKKPGAPGVTATGPLDPVKVDPKHYKVEFENAQVRVIRAKIGPHEKTALHEHKLNRAGIYLTDQDFNVTTQDGKVTHSVHKAGDTQWSTPVVHREENLSDKPFEIIAVEMKN